MSLVTSNSKSFILCYLSIQPYCQIVSNIGQNINLMYNVDISVGITIYVKFEQNIQLKSNNTFNRLIK